MAFNWSAILFQAWLLLRGLCKYLVSIWLQSTKFNAKMLNANILKAEVEYFGYGFCKKLIHGVLCCEAPGDTVNVCLVPFTVKSIMLLLVLGICKNLKQVWYESISHKDKLFY